MVQLVAATSEELGLDQVAAPMQPAEAALPDRKPACTARIDRVLSPESRNHRRHAPALGRPRHPGRRPPQAASDPAYRIIGVGLLYRRGYFRQTLSADGWQIEHYPLIDPYALPLALLRDAAGAPLRVRVGLPGGRVLAAQIWKAQVGRVPLLLLDSDIEDNGPGEREVTDKLYGGGTEHRLLQEMLLGIGGPEPGTARSWYA